MGGSPNLFLPVGDRRTSSWGAHQRRSPRSSEPGTDWYCPIGTPVYAPADGVIYGFGNTIGPATGRWVGIDFDNGMRFRIMHLSRLVRTGGRVARGDLIAYSGASGYGEEDWSWNPNTGGSHAHGTLWPTRASLFGYRRDGTPYTVDFMQYVGGNQAAGGTTTPVPEEDDMTPEQAAKLDQLAHDMQWVKTRIGGKDTQPSITELVRGALRAISAVGAGIDWLKARMGGSTKTAPTITDELRGLRDSDDTEA